MELEYTAQSYAEACHLAPNPSVTTRAGIRRGENLGYTQSHTTVLEGALYSMREWVEEPGDASYTQVRLSRGILSCVHAITLWFVSGTLVECERNRLWQFRVSSFVTAWRRTSGWCSLYSLLLSHCLHIRLTTLYTQ